MAKKAKIGQHSRKLFFPSLSAAICAGLPKFEDKIQRNKKVMPQGCLFVILNIFFLKCQGHLHPPSFKIQLKSL
jgi:hypothetical protein